MPKNRWFSGKMALENIDADSKKSRSNFWHLQLICIICYGYFDLWLHGSLEAKVVMDFFLSEVIFATADFPLHQLFSRHPGPCSVMTKTMTIKYEELNLDSQISAHEQRGADRDVSLPGRQEGGEDRAHRERRLPRPSLPLCWRGLVKTFCWSWKFSLVWRKVWKMCISGAEEKVERADEKRRGGGGHWTSTGIVWLSKL